MAICSCSFEMTASPADCLKCGLLARQRVYDRDYPSSFAHAVLSFAHTVLG